MWVSTDWDYVIKLLVTCSVIQQTVSSCSKQQTESCRDAAKGNKLGKFSAGGKCLNKQYVGYTHTCSVDTYLASTDFCCCEFDRKVMCCRYHQAGELFRCIQSDDTIETLPAEVPPLQVLLPAILVPLVVLACCVFCIVKCCCYNYDSDDNEYCDIPCLRKSKTTMRASTGEKRTPYDTQMSSDDQQPLNRQVSLCSAGATQYSRQPSMCHPASTATQYSTDSTNSESKLLPDSNDTPSRRGQPSAPPVEEEDEFPDSAFITFTNTDPRLTNSDLRYCRLNSESSTTSTPPYQAFAHVHYPRSNSGSSVATNQTGTSGMATCPSCASGVPSCPPPTYEEHHEHRII